MGNLDLFLGNLDPLSWMKFGIKYFAEDGGGDPPAGDPPAGDPPAPPATPSPTPSRCG